MTGKPVLAITMGDPAGIGPEVIAKAFKGELVKERSRPVVIGDLRVMADAAGRWSGGLKPVAVASVGSLSPTAGTMPVIDLNNCDPKKLKIGVVDAYSGQAAYEAVVRATEMAIHRRVDAIVTAPLNKEAMHLAGHKFDGHTGLLAHLCSATAAPGAPRKPHFMVLASPKLKVIHLTTHIDLGTAVTRVTADRIVTCIEAGQEHMVQLGVDKPRIGVCGLNPHAGENRLFGGHDEDEIRPAVETARKKGIDARGPLSPDTAFRHAVEGRWDIIVAMYHDQGHIPMKLVAFEDGVNVTVGLPIIRTSVDHGTAFDIAGKGVADAANMVAAIDYAFRLATGSVSRG